MVLKRVYGFCDNFVVLIIHTNIKAVLKQHICGNSDMMLRLRAECNVIHYVQYFGLKVQKRKERNSVNSIQAVFH